jgi:hypothetical protein
MTNALVIVTLFVSVFVPYLVLASVRPDEAPLAGAPSLVLASALAVLVVAAARVIFGRRSGAWRGESLVRLVLVAAAAGALFVAVSMLSEGPPFVPGDGGFGASAFLFLVILLVALPGAASCGRPAAFLLPLACGVCAAWSFHGWAGVTRLRTDGGGPAYAFALRGAALLPAGAALLATILLPVRLRARIPPAAVWFGAAVCLGGLGLFFKVAIDAVGPFLRGVFAGEMHLRLLAWGAPALVVLAILAPRGQAGRLLGGGAGVLVLLALARTGSTMGLVARLGPCWLPMDLGGLADANLLLGTAACLLLLREALRAARSGVVPDERNRIDAIRDAVQAAGLALPLFAAALWWIVRGARDGARAVDLLDFARRFAPFATITLVFAVACAALTVAAAALSAFRRPSGRRGVGVVIVALLALLVGCGGEGARDVDLPACESGGGPPAGEVVTVTIRPGGTFELDGRRVDFAGLVAALRPVADRERIEDHQNKPSVAAAWLCAPRDLPVGEFLRAVEAFEHPEIRMYRLHVAVLTARASRQPSPPAGPPALILPAGEANPPPHRP